MNGTIIKIFARNGGMQATGGLPQAVFSAALLASLVPGSALAATLVHYGFDEVDNVLGTSPVTFVAAGVSATQAANNNAGNPLGGSPAALFQAGTFTGNNADGTGITVGTGGTSSAGTGSDNVLNFRSNGSQTLAQATATTAGLPTSTRYFSFSLSATGGMTLDLSSISFDIAKGGTPNDRGVVVWYSTDGFTSTAATLGNGSENTALILSGNTDQLARNVSFSLDSLPDTIETIEFRFFAMHPTAGNTIKIDNIIVEGTVIPEPGTFALLLVFSAAVGFRRKR